MSDDVQQRVAAMMAEYEAEQVGENGDPEAYVERMWALLEGIRDSPEQNQVAIDALTTFLDRVERTNERPS